MIFGGNPQRVKIKIQNLCQPTLVSPRGAIKKGGQEFC